MIDNQYHQRRLINHEIMTAALRWLEITLMFRMNGIGLFHVSTAYISKLVQ